MPVGEDMFMVVRHDRLSDVAAAYFAAADDRGNVDSLLRHAFQAFLECGALGRSGSIALHGLVHGDWNAAIAVESRNDRGGDMGR